MSPLGDLVGRRGDVGQIEAVQPRLLVRPLDRVAAPRHPLVKRAKRLVGQPMVVFDQVDAPQRQAVSQISQLRGRQPHRLDGRT